MNAIMNEKGRQTKLLAAIAVIAMVICAIAVIVPSGVDGEEISVGANDDLQQAINNASAGDIIVLTAETYGSAATTTDVDGNYTLYTINKNLTIRAADGVTPDVYGEFLVNADSATFENINIYIQGNQGAADPIRNGITFYGDKLNVTGCTFHLGTEDTFGNGITFFPTSENAVLNVTENEFIGINYGNGSYSSSSISIAAQFVVSSYFAGVDNSSAWNVTDSELLSIYDNNSYTNCLYAVSYNDYNNTGSTGSIIDGVYVLVDGFYNGAECIRTYIPAGQTVDKSTGDDTSLTVTGTLYNYGTLNVTAITNNGIIYNAGTIAGNISGSGYVIDATTNDEASVAIDTGNNVEANTIKNLFDAGATEVTIESGAASLPSGFNGTIVIGENAGLITNDSNTPYVIGENSVLEIPSFGANSATFYFANSADANSPTVALKSFTGTDVTIRFGSIVIGGSGLSGTVDVDAGVELELTNAKTNDGSRTLAINLGNGSTLTMNGNVVVPQGSTLDVNTTTPASDKADAVLSRNMTLSVDGTISVGEGVTMDLSDGTLTGSGTISIEAGATLIYTAGTLGNVQIDNHGTVQIENGFGIENTVRTDLTLEGTDNYLANDITIEEGVTLTISRNAVLDLRGFDLTIKGTLVIERNGTILSSVSGGMLLLTSTGAIQNNNGIIGSVYAITIGNGEKLDGNGEPTQTVTMKGVSGVSLQLVRASDRTYDMFVSGDVSRTSGVDEHTLFLYNVGINADMTIGSGVELSITGKTVVSEDVTFTHNGSYMAVSGGTFELSNGTVAVFNSPVNGLITANVGVVTSGNVEPTDDATFDLAGVKSSNAPYTYSGVTGITISVDRVTYADPKDSTKTVVEQRVYVTGTLDFENTNSADSAAEYANIKFTNTIYVTDTLTVPSDVGIEATFDVSENGTVVVSEADSGVARTVTYTGASYIVETTENNTTVETTYYTGFANAMGQIASAMDQTVTVSGKFEISGTYELTGEQAIDYVGGARVTVAEDGQITVGTEADIDNLAFWEIQGRVIVTEGIGYRPAATYQGDADQYIYAVKTVESETNTTTYSGFGIAIDNASAGETITVVGDAIYDGNLVVPAQVTVDVNPDITLTVYGNVTVESEGTIILDNGSQLLVGETGTRDYTITVNGVIDASDGGDICKNATTGSVDMYSTGTVTVDSTTATLLGVDVNTAYYNDGGETVYTSVANAVAYAESENLSTIYVTGVFSENGSVESDGVSIIIQNDADVTLGDITLNGATISSATVPEASDAEMGVYTANVSGLSGVGDAAVTSTVSVNKSTATIGSVETLNAEGVSEYRLTIDKIDASTTVSAGTVEFIGIAANSNIDTTRELVLTINTGATLLIVEDTTITGEYIVNNGTISIDDGATLTVAAIMTGNVSVLEGGEMLVNTTATFTGNVSVDADGTFTVNGTVYVGEAPEILGQTASGTIAGDVDLGDRAIVYVYSGADVSGAVFENSGRDVNTTAYSINGTALVSVYTFAQIDIDNTTIDGIVYALKDLATGADTTTTEDDLNIVWYAGETPITSQTVGQYAEVITEIRYNTVGVVISIPGQITLSIDNVIVYGDKNLTIGTHTVSAVVNPGYSGEITITFNGQTIQNGGTIEITSEMLTMLDAPVLSVSGNITQDSTVVIDGGNGGSNDMGLTDYLLIILVILIVIMAIIVALRLMRS